MILNLSPMPDGTIPQRQKDILTAFGTFLRQMGTAIYNTRAWVVYGEGPTKLGGGEFTAPTALTASDVRYTASKDGDAVYAILGGWPGNGKQITLASVTSSRFALGAGKVFLFGPTGGSPIQLTATQDGSGLHVTLPSTQPYTAVAYAMKISKSGTAPAPTPWLTSVSDTDGGVATGGSGGTDGGRAPAATAERAVPRRARAARPPPAAWARVARALAVSKAPAERAVRAAGWDGTGGGIGTGGANATGGVGAMRAAESQTGGNGTGGTIAGSGGTGASGAMGGSGEGGSGTGGATNGQSGSAAGCSCATGAGRSNPDGSVVFLGFAVGLVLRRRRRR